MTDKVQRISSIPPALLARIAIIPGLLVLLFSAPTSQAQCAGISCGPDTESIKFEWSDNKDNDQTKHCYGGFVVQLSSDSEDYVLDLDGSGKAACFMPDTDGKIGDDQYDGYNLPAKVTEVVFDPEAGDDKIEILGAKFESNGGVIETAWYKNGRPCYFVNVDPDGGNIISTRGISHLQICYKPPAECPEPDFDFAENIISDRAPGKVELVMSESTQGITEVNFVDQSRNPYLINFTASLTSGNLITEDGGITWKVPAGEALPTTVKMELDQTDVNVQAAAYFVEFVSPCGSRHLDPVLSFESEAPETFELEGNYPNPFNPSTKIQFKLAEPAAVSVTVYDVTGRQVKKLVSDQEFGVGSHSTEWDGTDLHGRAVVSGVYLYRVDAGVSSANGKMVLLK